MPTFTHLINPFTAPAGSEHALMQPITFASILRAKKEIGEKVKVELCAVTYAREEKNIPAEFHVLPNLLRSLPDLGVSGRKLPLLGEILARAKEHSQSDYIIYTNIDICLMPGFYFFCNAMAEKGLDAFVINRRRIPKKFSSPDQLEMMYAEAGEMHTGYDTFVFKRSLLDKFVLENIAVGVPYHDTVLIHNLYAFAENFRLFTKKHLTFHIGMELVKEWGNDAQYRHNRKELKTVLKELYPHFKIENFPGASLPFFKRHFKWLMNPTFHYPTLFKLDLSQLSHKRRKYPVDGTEQQRYLNRMIRRVNFPEEE
ncbi:MAG: hypothetical protein HY064_00470 [Bacteroidetes bacterium]|nr:hypothetical protein [Bacteroidota bacterium]